MAFNFLKNFNLRKIFGKISGEQNSADDSERVELKFASEMNFASVEAYNLLRTNLYFALPKTEGRGNVIAITSSVPQEGKSYTSINLAYTLAKDGKKVLLIDGDMRKPSIAGKLKMDNKTGLSNLLSQQSTEDIFVDCLHENMKVLFAGPTPPNPSELIGSQQMGILLEKWRTEFDYVILDLPPVNVVTDALVVSQYIDGIIVAVRHGYSRKKEITECIRQLRFAKVHILGCIYRGFSHGGHYYKKKYYKNSYYKSAETPAENKPAKPVASDNNKTVQQDRVADLHERLGKINKSNGNNRPSGKKSKKKKK